LIKYKPYLGCGSRETPNSICHLFTDIAEALADARYTLRTGGAPGADNAFLMGALPVDAERVELYLPWSKFEGWAIGTTPQAEAFEIAAQFHPAWGNLKQGAKKLHARNVHQVLGPDVTAPIRSKFIICWTEGGKMMGGTAQALRMAEAYDIHVFNAGTKEGESLVRTVLKDLRDEGRSVILPV
jgi:hypothetical protein